METFKPSIEFSSPPEIAARQNQLLQKALLYLRDKSPYYGRLFRDHGIDISLIKCVDDLAALPITTKEDIQRHNNDFLCVHPSQVIDHITTSGTLGDPVTLALTDNDLERLAYNEAISFTCAKGSADDIYQLMTTIDKRFMAGLAYFLGIRKMGAGIIRVGNGAPQLQWDTIQRIQPNTIVCVPSFILKIIDYAEKNGIDYRGSTIRKAICIGESLREQDFSLNLLGRTIKDKWDIELYSTYASSEMATSFTECEAGCGGHHHPELIVTEVVDSAGRPVADGGYGELVITNLGVEGMPLLRFNTGDIACFHSEPCGCGRATKRISPIVGRMNQMIKYKGTTLYPSSVFDVLDHCPGVAAYYVEVATNEIGTDSLKAHIATNGEDPAVVGLLKDMFKAKLRVTPEIIVGSASEIHAVNDFENNRKPIKFVDKRPQNSNDYQNR